MKVSTVLKPAMLFAAGSAASVASAAPPVETAGPFTPSYTFPFGNGTEITLAGATSPQYYYQNIKTSTDPFIEAGFYNIQGNEGALVTSTAEAAAFFPTADDARLGSSVVTGSYNNPKSARQAQLLADPADSFYGLRFSADGKDYTGYAQVAADGATISEIGYRLAAAAGGVPEPSTWALMIAGFGGVGLAMRRRRRQAPTVAVA